MGLKLHWSGSSALNATVKVLINPKLPEKFQHLPRKHPGVGQGRPVEELGVMAGAPAAILDDEATLKPYAKPKPGKCLCLWICSVFAMPMPYPSLFPGFFKGEKKGFLCRRPTLYPKWEIRKRWLERLYTLVIKDPHASFRSILLTFLWVEKSSWR